MKAEHSCVHSVVRNDDTLMTVEMIGGIDSVGMFHHSVLLNNTLAHLCPREMYSKKRCRCCCDDMQESFLNTSAVTKPQRTFLYLTFVLFPRRDFLPRCLPPGYQSTSLEGEMPASFSSSGNPFKYSQMLQARRLNFECRGKVWGGVG